jgi:hypothetical protein
VIKPPVVTLPLPGARLVVAKPRPLNDSELKQVAGGQAGADSKVDAFLQQARSCGHKG